MLLEGARFEASRNSAPHAFIGRLTSSAQGERVGVKGLALPARMNPCPDELNHLPIRERPVGPVIDWNWPELLGDLCDQLQRFRVELDTEAGPAVWPHLAVLEVV